MSEQLSYPHKFLSIDRRPYYSSDPPPDSCEHSHCQNDCCEQACNLPLSAHPLGAEEDD